MKIRSFIAVLLFVLTASHSIAGQDRGGGDSDAVDFLIYVKTFSLWVQEVNLGLTRVEREQVLNIAQDLAKKMDKPTETPIRMIESPLRDQSGAIKTAIFITNPLSILVDRRKWKGLTESEKFVIVGLELYGLVGIPNRYDLAGEIQKSAMTLSSIRDDLQLLSFISGNWDLLGGNCASGSDVNWGQPTEDFKNYKMTFVFDQNLTFRISLSKNRKTIFSSQGSFAIQHATLIMTTKERCRFDSDKSPCENGLSEQERHLLTIQKDQIWLLSNQGALGGSCGIQDIFTMKLEIQRPR